VGFIVRQLPQDAKLSDVDVFDALAATIPPALVHQLVHSLGVARQRCRKLPAQLTLLLPIALALFPTDAADAVLAKLLQGVRFIWPDPAFQPASKGAICRARYQLGARPLAHLFRAICRPLATPETPGAFRFGLRLVAWDGTVESVPDTPANRRYFGGPTNQRGAGSFPQARGVYLVECGTHAVIDGGFWPYRIAERVGAQRLLRSLAPGMLVLWDRGFHSAALIVAVQERGAHVLGRVPSYVRLPVREVLPDGSYLCRLSTGKDWQRPRQPGPLVRVVVYTLTDPQRPGYREHHRLVTTLLDPSQASADDLVQAYHERWEVELVIDEIDTHQRLARQPLRSQHPVGVLQELYGILIAHYAIRALLVAAAAPRALDPRRLSFVWGVRLVGIALAEFQEVVAEQRAALYARLLADVQRHVLPERAERQYPRVIKCRRSKYPPKRAEHHRWPQPSKPFGDAIEIVK